MGGQLAIGDTLVVSLPDDKDLDRNPQNKTPTKRTPHKSRLLGKGRRKSSGTDTKWRKELCGKFTSI